MSELILCGVGGMCVGFFLGIAIMSCCIIAKQSDEEIDEKHANP